MPDARNEKGFTLVEALIALTISGIVASALVSLLIGQSRFYERTDDQLNAEQVAQATFDLLSTEIRLAGASDLLAAEADSLALRYDVVQGVVCDQTTGDAAAMYVYERTTNAGLTGSFVGIGASGPYTEEFEYADGWNPTPSATGLAPKAVCTLAGFPGTGALTDYVELSGWTGHFSATPSRGTMVRGYGRVSYTIAPSTFFASRWSVWRGTQELVGPFESGAAFSYVMDDGSVQSSVTSSDFDGVVAVRLSATAVGDGANRFGVNRTVDFEVPFRN